MPPRSGAAPGSALASLLVNRDGLRIDLKEGRASAAEAAVYVQENSAEKLGEAIGRLLDDPAARERMGQLGEERLRTQLNWERSAEQLLAAYRKALEE